MTGPNRLAILGASMLEPDDDPLVRPLARLLELAGHDRELRAALRQLAQAVLSALPEVEDEAAEPAKPAAAEGATAVQQPNAASAEDIARLIEATAFRQNPDPGSAPGAREPHAEFDPETLLSRLHLKLEACRWLLEHGYTEDSQALAERVRLIERGRDLGCHLWMLDPRIVSPAATSQHALLAGNLEVTAEALALWQACEGEDEEVAAARLLAEAQAALRAAVAEARSVNPYLPNELDADQSLIFTELRSFAEISSTYLDFLKLESLPDPSVHADLRRRVALLCERHQSRKRTGLERQRQLRRLHYHAEHLRRGSHNPAHDLKRVRETVHDLVAAGLPESAPSFDAALHPILDRLEGGAEDALVARVAGFVRARSRAGVNPHGPPVSAKAPELPSAEVQRLARLLTGRTVVMIGGSERPQMRAKIEEAFGCRLDWLESQPHQSHYDFAPAIVRPEVALVLLLIRWSSHSFAEVANFCREHDKPLVRVPSGYGVNSLARAILDQASRQLEALAL